MKGVLTAALNNWRTSIGLETANPAGSLSASRPRTMRRSCADSVTVRFLPFLPYSTKITPRSLSISIRPDAAIFYFPD